MSAEKDLNKLLSSISPKLLPKEYVFCSVEGKYGEYANLDPIASFKEDEGLTLVITKESATYANLEFKSTFRAITLTVYSSLDAVGLTAAVSTKLAEKNISANVVAAYYHDHIFVPVNRAKEAIEALNEFKNKEQK